MLINLIGSIFKFNYDNVEEIMVFNLGLSQAEIDELNSIDKVNIYEVECTHPEIIAPQTIPKIGRVVVGSFAWKPVIMKQALDKHEYILYLDAGTTIMGPLDDLFGHIVENGYFLTDSSPWSIRWQTTEFVAQKLNLYSPERSFILKPESFSIDAGFQGLSRKVYNDYVLPVYELTKDMRYFIDDGTAPDGYGCGRHDQTLFSIYARLLGYNIEVQDQGTGRRIPLKVSGKEMPLHLTWNNAWLANDTAVFRSRTQLPWQAEFKKHLRYKPHLLIKIPTRGRPEQFFARLDKYEALLSHEYPCTFLITCDEDDASMNCDSVKERLKAYKNVVIGFSQNKTKVEAYNKDIDKFENWFDILLLASDDMEPLVNGYDKIIVKAMQKNFPNFDGVLNFNDGQLGTILNTMPVIGKTFYKRFGYAYCPEYISLFCDQELTEVSQRLGKEAFIDRVIIEHKHPCYGKGKWDSLYERNQQFKIRDENLFHQRKARKFGISDLRD